MTKCILVLLILGLQDPPPSNGKDSQPAEDKAKAVQTDTPATNPPAELPPSASPAVSNVNAVKNQQGTADTTDYRQYAPPEKGWDIPEIVMAITSVVMVGVGIGQLIMYCRQWSVMERALTQAARISRKQLKHATHSNERAQRAYLCVLTSIHDLPNATSAKLVKPPEGFSIVLKNTGQTPAYKVVSFVTWKYFTGNNTHWPDDVPFKNAKEIDAANPDPRGSADTIGGGQTIQVDARFDPNKKRPTFSEAYVKLMTGLASLYAYGEVAYEDAFGRPHRTEFCVRFRFTPDEKNRPEWPSGSVSFTTYDRHNHAD